MWLSEVYRTTSNSVLIIHTEMGYNSIAAGKTKTFYMWFVPGLYTEGHVITLKALNYSATVGSAGSFGSKKQKDFQPGKNYRVAIDITGTSPNYKLNFVPWE